MAKANKKRIYQATEEKCWGKQSSWSLESTKCNFLPERCCPIWTSKQLKRMIQQIILIDAKEHVFCMRIS